MGESRKRAEPPPRRRPAAERDAAATGEKGEAEAAGNGEAKAALRDAAAGGPRKASGGRRDAGGSPLGELIMRDFDGVGFLGRIVSVLPAEADDEDLSPWFKVSYQDGDSEDLSLEDVQSGLSAVEDLRKKRQAAKRRRPADEETGRRPIRRRSVGLLRRARAVLSGLRPE